MIIKTLPFRYSRSGDVFADANAAIVGNLLADTIWAGDCLIGTISDRGAIGRIDNNRAAAYYEKRDGPD